MFESGSRSVRLSRRARISRRGSGRGALGPVGLGVARDDGGVAGQILLEKRGQGPAVDIAAAARIEGHEHFDALAGKIDLLGCRFPDDRAFIGFDNYITVLSSVDLWWKAFGVTALITVISVAIELVLQSLPRHPEGGARGLDDRPRRHALSSHEHGNPDNAIVPHHRDLRSGAVALWPDARLDGNCVDNRLTGPPRLMSIKWTAQDFAAAETKPEIVKVMSRLDDYVDQLSRNGS